MNDLVLEKVDEIVKILKESAEYQEYQLLFSKLSKNEKIKKRIQEVKAIQKQIVKKEIQKESTDDLEEQLHVLLEQLNQIPLYVDFIEKQDQLNKIYQKIKLELEMYFEQLLN